MLYFGGLKKICITTMLGVVLIFGSVVFYPVSVRAVEQGAHTLPLLGSPVAPEGLMITPVFPTTGVTLRWNEVPGADYYVIYRNTINSFDAVLPIGKTLFATTTYIDAGSPSSTLYYKVAGVNSQGEGYNSNVSFTAICNFTTSSSQGGGSLVVKKVLEIGSLTTPSQSPLPAYTTCPGFEVTKIGEGAGEVPPSSSVSHTYWLPINLASQIIFKNLPVLNQVAITPGGSLKFNYTWTNELSKNQPKNQNKKFTIRRRLWDSQGNKILEKHFSYIVYPGKSRNITVHEVLKSNLPKGEYTMEVEVLHYIPYSDEADMVVDKNSFKFLVQ